MNPTDTHIAFVKNNLANCCLKETQWMDGQELYMKVLAIYERGLAGEFNGLKSTPQFNSLLLTHATWSHIALLQSCWHRVKANFKTVAIPALLLSELLIAGKSQLQPFNRHVIIRCKLSKAIQNQDNPPQESLTSSSLRLISEESHSIRSI